jgi:hypothetical protein
MPTPGNDSGHKCRTCRRTEGDLSALADPLTRVDFRAETGALDGSFEGRLENLLGQVELKMSDPCDPMPFP